MGEKSNSLTFMQMKGIKEEREKMGQKLILKNYFFLKFMLIRFIDTKSLSNTKLKNSKENQIQVYQIEIYENF